MLKIARFSAFLIAAFVVASMASCQKPAEKPLTSGVKSSEGQPPAWLKAEKDEITDATQVKKPQEPLPPPVIPKVLLSDELRATCLVNVGDALPQVELQNLEGKVCTPESLYGPKLTVVCFWTIGATRRSELVASVLLKDLAKYVVEPFGSKGVGVVAISVGNSVQEVQQKTGQVERTVPILLDPDGKLYGKVASDRKMPRVFLLGPDGKVLWFDIEYSNDFRRNLLQSIRVALGEL